LGAGLAPSSYKNSVVSKPQQWGSHGLKMGLSAVEEYDCEWGVKKDLKGAVVASVKIYRYPCENVTLLYFIVF
jgi:hypothetical protein